ncbi:PAS domain S-box-containing protein [Pseudoxanthomonas sp. GM95]|uniref:PAS domain-containing hybrid sensor histidine kinase/response regulator n=1 Tax=Pseudoxanthomonas sp. GM95 TaxID=1881043 RepID=UPI0008BCC2A5|nr:response regulator [Pseudoxanthomonas sp. GM95]SEL94702.1 PAS domain S-box-containing protein [Pseudoxanthomonas sp. GM95]
MKLKHSFLIGGGRLAELIERYDWAATSLGPIDAWPPALRTTIALMLQSPVPIVTLWGRDGVMIYNDAYSEFAGERHPSLLGSNVREGWGEIASFNDNVVSHVLLGNQPLSYKDMELALNRDGQFKTLWMDLDYSPVLDESGTPIGVFAIVVETTERVLAQRANAAERERLAQLFEQAPSFMAVVRGPEHRFELANPAYRRVVGNRDVIGHTVGEVLPDVADQYLALLDKVFADGEAYSARGAPYVMQTHSGGPSVRRVVDFVFQPIKDELGRVSGIFIEGVDVTQRARSEVTREALVALTDAIRDASDPGQLGQLASIILGKSLEASRVGYAHTVHDDSALVITSEWGDTGAQRLGRVLDLRPYRAIRAALEQGQVVVVGDIRHDELTAEVVELLEGWDVGALINVPILEHGRLVAVLYVNTSQPRAWEDQEVAMAQEFVARIRTAEQRLHGEAALREANETLEQRVEQRTHELLQAEEALRQAQKMEAVGQLTGGIAHDFNNLLTAITGGLELLKMRLAQGRTQDLDRYINVATNAASRAASLTHRLLAFSRRQTLSPKPTDVKQLVSGIAELIQRTVGPEIALETVNAAGLWPSMIDPSQLENAILNLCINARDAMPNGGKITIETGNRWIDQRTASQRGIAPGQYISLCVSDSGTGMTADVIAKAFDPFFTTKPIGMGTGLGLSMIYGFARQSGGAVSIYSELDKGTMVCIYLPRHVGDVEQFEDSLQLEEAPRSLQGETVLVVDDEPAIRALISDVLGDLGYSILEAEDGASGLKILNSDARIDLLVSDVGLPGGMNGRQMADAGRMTRPDLKVLFITGYAENAVLSHGHLDQGMHVLTKPFSLDDLATRIRELINL